MITRNQAVERSENSGAAMTEYIEKIGRAIGAAADLNKREILLDECMPSDPLWEIVKNSYSHPNLGTPRHIAVCKELRKYGFTVTTDRRVHHIGGGLGSMDEPRDETWSHYIIKW